MNVNSIGAVCFGVIIGWVTYRTLRRTNETVAVSNIASVVGTVGGAAITGLFKGSLFVSIQGYSVSCGSRRAVQLAGTGSQGSPARARVMASRAVSPWLAAESR